MMNDCNLKISERHVQAIWYDVRLRPNNLVTRRGSSVSVISPGEWNLGAGPDFRNAVLEIGKEKRRLVGDVEVHLCPADWDFHKHGADPAYRNVIAHVTWRCGPDPASLPSDAVSIWLGRFVMSNAAFSPEQIDLEAYPYARLPEAPRPCERRLSQDVGLSHRILRAAGSHRLRMKARRLAGRLSERIVHGGVSPDEARRQVFYEEVMSALGYVRNATPFRRVAERVPIAALPEDADAARVALLTAGGFEEWHVHGSRPNNDPERRLSAAADLFVRTPIMSYAAADDFSAENCRRMVKGMCGDGFLGKGRAAAVLSNVIVPFAVADGRLQSLPEWLPAEDISEPVRLTSFRLFGRDHNPAAFYAANGLYIQGILQIYRDYCLQRHPECDACDMIDSLRDASC